MNFVKPLHLYEVYLYESTKKNAFSIINSEPTTTVRKKIYADRYEISGGGLTFFQSAKDASDELKEVPVVSFPNGKWESVSLIRNKIIIAEHRTGASTGASHVSIQPELKKPKGNTTNTFKIIQMPSNTADTNAEFSEINKLLAQVNILVENQKEALKIITELPVNNKIANNYFKEENENNYSFKDVPNTNDVSDLMIPSENALIENNQQTSNYSKETISLHNSVDEQELLDDLNSIEKKVVTEVDLYGALDDFDIDIDAITSSMEDHQDIIGQEVEISKPIENLNINLNINPKKSSENQSDKNKDEKEKNKSKNVEPPLSVDIPDDDNILDLLETLSPALLSQNEYKEIQSKKKSFITSNLNSYIKASDIFKLEYFHDYLKNENEYEPLGIKISDIEWEISKLLIDKLISPRKFIKEKIQKHISILLPPIMKKYWEGNIIPILDIAKTHNEIKEITLIDLGVWFSQNGYK